SGSVPSIDIANGAEVFAVASDEGRTDAYRGGAAPDRGVQVHAELHHGIGFVDLLVAKVVDRGFLKSGPRGGYDGLVFGALSGNIEQSEDDPVRRGAHEMVKVAAHPRSMHDGGELGPVDRGKLGTSGRERACTSSRSLEWKFHARLGTPEHRRRKC